MTPTDDQQPAHPAPRIEVHIDAADLATAVAGELIARLEAAQARGEEPQIGLTGGSIAVAVHDELARMGASSDVDWSRVVLWWGDERFVAADSDDRNDRPGDEGVRRPARVRPRQGARVPSTAEAGSVDEAATAYAAALREHGAGSFEVLMLGMGPDGHVASLFPGSPQLDVDDQVAVGVTGSPKPPSERVSLTFGALNRSRSVWFLVSGEGKADAVARALSPGTDPHEIPAAGVTGELETIWFLDRASASEL